MRKGSFLLFFIACAAIHADGPFTSDDRTSKPMVKKALTPSKEDEQKARILALRAALLAKKPELSSAIINMERVLRSPQAMENYLRSMLDSANVTDFEKPGEPANQTDVNAQNDTAKVDAEMARLEKSNRGNLGIGTDATHDPGTYPLENTATNRPSLSPQENTGENVVEQADAAFEKLKEMIEEKRRLLEGSNDVNSGASHPSDWNVGNSNFQQQPEPSARRSVEYEKGVADKAHVDTDVSSTGLADFKSSHPVDGHGEADRKSSLLWHLDSQNPVPSNQDEDPERKGRETSGILSP